MNPEKENPGNLVTEIRQLIAASQQQVAVTVNATITLLYWQVGKRINEDILQHQRAGYGEQIVQTLSTQLRLEYASGWSEKQLRHCLRFAETMQDEQIVSALRRQLSWSHFLQLLPLKNNGA